MPILKSQANLVPGRSGDGTLIFKDAPEFRPTLTPKEVLHLGSFGGGYFRKIKSAVTMKEHDREWEKAMPKDWWEGLDLDTYVASQVYRPKINRYGVRSGVTLGKNDPFGLQAWEAKGWIDELDPYGWYEWYCFFYQGRRSTDDERQIARWMSICGLKGRWKNNLIAKCVKANAAYDDESIAPVVRQTLQHWAYRLTQADFADYSEQVRSGASTAFLGQVVQAGGNDQMAQADAQVGTAPLETDVGTQSAAEGGPVGGSEVVQASKKGRGKRSAAKDSADAPAGSPGDGSQGPRKWTRKGRAGESVSEINRSPQIGRDAGV